MKFIGAFCWPTLLLLLSGCANNDARFQQLRDNQLDVANVLQEQSQQLYIQQKQIEQLEADKIVLAEQVYELEGELAVLHPGETSADAEATSKTEPQAVDRPVKRDGAFDKVVLGRLEWIWFDLFGRYVATRIDTGIKSSVIYASDIRFFERDGDSWVRFNFLDNNPEIKEEDQKSVTLEAPVVKKIRFKNGAGVSLGKRPAIRLRFKIGDLVDDSLFLLIEKDPSANAVVVGRTFLRDFAVVDSDKTFTQVKPKQ